MTPPEPETPEWWLQRLYKKLRERRVLIRSWDAWYVGDHPAPQGYERAEALMQRLLENVGLNVLALVTNAGLERQHIEGFKIKGEIASDLWSIWQSNNMDLGAEQVQQEKQALSAAYVLVDPNTRNRRGFPTVTPEHPEQAITESYPADPSRRVGLKVWADDITSTVQARVYMDDGQVVAFAAPTRLTTNWTLAMRPNWERQESDSGETDLGACALVPFFNRARMMADPLPEFYPAIAPQRRLNKTLLDRMSMQDQGAFKAWWATGMKIEIDPQTGLPRPPVERSIDRLLVNEDPAGKFGQMQAEDIKQILEACHEDVVTAAMLVPTPPDMILGQLINVAADGLKLAQSSLVSRVRMHMRHDEEGWEEVARLMLRGAGMDSPEDEEMDTIWRNPEYRSEGEMAQAGLTAQQARVPDEAVWTRYFNATPQEVASWQRQNDEQVAREAAIGVKAVQDAASGGA